MLNDFYQTLDPIAFSLGPLTVRWYALAYLAGFLAAALVIHFTAKRWRKPITFDDLLTIIALVMVGILVGGRLGYCLFYGDGYYFQHPAEILAINKGGMSFHGGLIGVLIAGVAASKMLHIPFLTLADLGAIAAPIGLFLGRCANFVNGELWGAVTDLPWGVVFGGNAGMMPRHPSQLYEALLEGLLIFLVLFALSRKVPARPRGTFLGLFLVLYGVFRFLIEFVRQPDSQLGYLWGGWLTMGQCLSFPLIIVGVCLLVYAAKKRLPQQGSVFVGAPVAAGTAAAGEGSSACESSAACEYSAPSKESASRKKTSPGKRPASHKKGK
ncbi:MAG: prolipoprotein diacylglyceryl transferase [Eggerthellaceae bacterium]